MYDIHHNVHTVETCSILQSDELAAAKVFEEFKASFEDTGKGGKTFVRGQIINPDDPGTV